MSYYGYYNDEGYETTMDIIIVCPNKDCAKYDKDQEVDDVIGTMYHGTFGADVTCPSCGHTFYTDREYSEYELYTGPDTLAEARGDA